MDAKSAAWVFKQLRAKHYNCVARYINRGALVDQHAVEIEPGHDLSTDDFEQLVAFAREHGYELSFGKSPRRVVALS